MRPLSFLSLAAACSFLAAPAAAELPAGVAELIEAAIATGDAAKVKTVLDLARQTNPDETQALDAIAAEFTASQTARKAAADLAKKETVRTAGMLELWSGEGEIGAFQATGNTENLGLTFGIKAKREGLQWSHRIRARVDYQEQDQRTKREQLLLAYEPRWQFDDDMFVYGLAQLDRDRLQGVARRYAASGGLGYDVFDREGLRLSIKAGPAWRVTNYVDGSSASRIAGLFGADFDWEIVKGLTFTQDTNAVAEGGGEVQVLVDGSNTSVNLVNGLDFKISEKLRSRLSYAVDYDSNPVAGTQSTDTLTRFAVVYGL